MVSGGVFSRFFGGGGSGGPQEDRHAGNTDFAALLVAAARADDDYTQVEADLITRILAAYYAIDQAEATGLRQRGEAAHSEASSDMFGFATGLKKRYSSAARLVMLEGLWSVVLSDQERHPREEALIRQTASILGLGHRDRVQARRRVEERMASGGE